MQRFLYLIILPILLASCGGELLDTEFNLEDQYVYEQIEGTFYQIEAHLEAADPDFDYVGTELTTERVDISHCKLFTKIQGDTVELWDRSIYKEVVEKIRSGRIYNVQYDKMFDPNGFDKTLDVIGDEMRATNLSVPKAFNEAGEAYELTKSGTGQLIVNFTTANGGTGIKSINMDEPIVADYMVTDIASNREIKIEETHRIVRIIENPIIKYPKTQYSCF